MERELSRPCLQSLARVGSDGEGQYALIDCDGLGS